MTAWGSAAVLAAIRVYQRFVSPYKGFVCAYRCHTGYASCSALGFRVIRRYGVRRGVGLLRQRFERCAVAHERYSPMARSRLQQAGFCDLSCDLPCDVPHLDCSDFVACDLPCDCGNGDRNKRKDGTREEMYIPPMKTRHGMAAHVVL